MFNTFFGILSSFILRTCSYKWNQPRRAYQHICITEDICFTKIKSRTVVPLKVTCHTRRRSQGSSFSIGSDYGLDGRGSIADRGRGFFFSSLHPDNLWGPPSPLYNGYWGLFPRG
jgi:hypothetical protein